MTADGAVAMGGWRGGVPTAAWVGVAVILVAAGLAGFVVHPLLGYGVLGLLVAPVLVANPRWMLFVFAAMLPFDGVASIDETTRTLTLTRLFGVAVFGAWALHVLVEKRPIRLTRPALWFVGFAAFATLSLAWAADFGVTLKAVITLAQLLLLSIVAADLLRDPRDVRLTIDVMLASTLVVALLVLSEVNPAKRATLLFMGRSLEPNFLAAALACPAVAAIGVGTGGRSLGVWRALAVVPIALAIFLTGSRGGGIAFVGGAAVIGIVRRRISPGVAVAALGLAVLLPAVVPQTTIDRLWMRYADAEQDRLAGRLDIWKTGTAMVRAHPIAGTAYGGFSGAFYDFMLTAGVDPEFGRMHARGNRAAHNIYLCTVAELGVVGGALLAGALAAHVALLWRARQVARRPRSRDPEHERLLAALLGVFTSLALMGSSLDLLGSKATWLWFGMMQATAMATFRGPGARRA